MDARRLRHIGLLCNSFLGITRTFLTLLTPRRSELTYVQWVLVAGYRLWFHPLSKYHGPRLSWLSNIWAAWYAYQQTGHLRAYQDYQTYGASVWLKTKINGR